MPISSYFGDHWFTPGMVLMVRVFFGLDVDAVRPIAQIRAHPERAFLFIQCRQDQTVAMHHGLEMKAASANPANSSSSRLHSGVTLSA